MKIVVTGGAGFIGSHIADALIEKKHKVVVIDNLSTGTKKNLNPKAKFYKVDITSPKIEGILKKEKPEVVYHLAAHISVSESLKDPVGDAHDNIIGSLNLFNACVAAGVKKVIFSSTGGAIYGDTTVRPTPENFVPKPISPYGIAKLSIEQYLEFYKVVHDLKSVVLRYSNVYGPRQNSKGEAGVVAIFCDRAKTGAEFRKNGTGGNTRDYVFVDDVVTANLKALKNSVTGIYNVGTGKETSLNTLVQELQQHFPKARVSPAPAVKGEQRTSCLSYSKIQKELGWKPSVSFKEGIKRTSQWFKDHA